MSTLYLTCYFCGRKQADGLLSRGAWGHLETATSETLRACPKCKSEHEDWETRLVVVAGGGSIAFPASESTPA
jgi:hypothetical protein